MTALAACGGTDKSGDVTGPPASPPEVAGTWAGAFSSIGSDPVTIHMSLSEAAGVGFMVRWAVASIPAVIILVVIGVLYAAVLAALGAGLRS